MIDQWAGLLWVRFKDLYGQKWVSLFQGDEAIESWRVTWASGLHADADQIKFALSRIGTEHPEWPPTFGQFKALCDAMPKPYIALAAPKIVPSPERAEEFRKAVAGRRQRMGAYWTPDKVVNAAQVDFIVQQARHFGSMSSADRFLDECKAFGCISAENQLQKPGKSNVSHGTEQSAVMQ